MRFIVLIMYPVNLGKQIYVVHVSHLKPKLVGIRSRGQITSE